MKKFFRDFKAFITKGNILDLAVAVIMGTAFNKIVTSLVNDMLMPLICSIFGKSTVSELAFYINGTAIHYGSFLQAIIDFLLIAITLFIILKAAMGAKGFTKKLVKSQPTRAEKKELKAQGVNMKDRKAVQEALASLRESKIVKVEPKPTTEALLAEILAELKSQTENKAAEKIEEVVSAPKARKAKVKKENE